MASPSIRRFTDNDAAATAQIFFDAVHVGTRAHYDATQRRAWAPEVPETSSWRQRLAAQTTFVAEQGGRIVGFMTIDQDGYIDLAFVAPPMIGQGIAKLLYDHVEAAAAHTATPRLHTAASHLARPFFERQGWSVVKRQTVSLRGVSMTNFVMEKAL